MRTALKPLLGLVLVQVLVGCGAFKSDHDGEVIKPKPWGPPGGAAKFNPGARGAPSKPPAQTEPAKTQ